MIPIISVLAAYFIATFFILAFLFVDVSDRKE